MDSNDGDKGAHTHTHKHTNPLPLKKNPTQIAVGLNLRAVIDTIIYKNTINKCNILMYNITINSLYK